MKILWFENVTSDHLRFLGSVDIEGYLVVTYFDVQIFSLGGQFSDIFYRSVNCTRQV